MKETLNPQPGMRKILPSLQKILLSILIAVAMCTLWMVIIMFIDLSKLDLTAQINTNLLQRTPFAYLYYWLSVFLPGNPPHYEPTETLAFLSNTILYFILSYVLLSLFGSDKINARKIVSVLVGVLINPILILILFYTDWHITSKMMLSLTQLDRAFFGYMFNWSSRILPFQLDFRAEILLAHISNTILYFALTYGLLSLLSRLISRKNELR